MKTTWSKAEWYFNISNQTIFIAELFHNCNYVTLLACVIYLIYVSNSVTIHIFTLYNKLYPCLIIDIGADLTRFH